MVGVRGKAVNHDVLAGGFPNHFIAYHPLSVGLARSGSGFINECR